jgi:hypothetical protein
VFLSRDVAPSIIGSVVSGIQMSGMPQLTIFAPMKPAGATPMIVNGWPLIWYVDPTTNGSEPYFPSQAWKLSTATGGAPSWSSASVNSLPRQADTPSVRKKLPETYWPLAVSGGADDPARRTPSAALPAWSAVRSWKPGVLARNSLYASHGKRLQSFGSSLPSWLYPPQLQQRAWSLMRQSCSGSAPGIELSITCCTSVKMAVVAPMPSASVSTAVRVKPGDLRNRRNACKKSASMISRGKGGMGRSCAVK